MSVCIRVNKPPSNFLWQYRVNGKGRVETVTTTDAYVQKGDTVDVNGISAPIVATPPLSTSPGQVKSFSYYPPTETQWDFSTYQVGDRIPKEFTDAFVLFDGSFPMGVDMVSLPRRWTVAISTVIPSFPPLASPRPIMVLAADPNDPGSYRRYVFIP